MKRLLTLFFVLILSMLVVCANENDKTLSASATYTLEKKDPKLIKIPNPKPIAQKDFEKKIAKDKVDYQKYNNVVSGDSRKLAIIIDKILRANNLQYQNWRFGMNIAPQEINAYSTSVNLIIMNSSLYDSLYQDEDSLAFILSHEIAHILCGHLQQAAVNSYSIQQIEAEIQRMSRKANDNAGAAAAILILNKKLNNIYENERLMEIEADVVAINLMTQAGYKSDKALDALDFISNVPNVYTKRSTHPDPITRRKYATKELNMIDYDDLTNQGRANLYKNNVSILKKGSDKKTIIFSQAKNCTKDKYIPDTYETKLIKKAYKCYLNNDFNSSKGYFIEAYKTNKENYIPALYLSYINEYEFKQNPSKASLKKAGYWTKKAVKLNPTNIYVNQQKNDMINLVKELKANKKEKQENL